VVDTGGRKSLLGLFSRNRGNDEASEYLEIIKNDPENDRAYTRLAEIYARMGDEDGAIATYEKAAAVFEKKGFINKAKAVLRQALVLNQEHGRVNLLLGDLDRQDGLDRDALLRYQTAANYYARREEKDTAVDIFKKIIQMYPENASFVLKLANLLVSDKKYEEVEKLLRPLAIKLKGRGRRDEYIVAMRLLYTATKGDIEISKNLLEVYMEVENFQAALSVLHKMIVRDPESIPLLEKLAKIFEKSGEDQKLISTYKQIAAIHNKRRELSENIAIYRKVLTIDPRDTEALLALKEDGKLRDLISNKIDRTSAGIEGSSSRLNSEITIDLELEDDDSSSLQSFNLATILKEARVFKSYNLYDKSLKKIMSFPGWKTSYAALDLIIEVCIENGDSSAAEDHIFTLLDLAIENNDQTRIEEVYNDAKEFVGENHPQMQRIKAAIFHDTEKLEQPIILSSKSEERPSLVDESPNILSNPIELHEHSDMALDLETLENKALSSEINDESLDLHAENAEDLVDEMDSDSDASILSQKTTVKEPPESSIRELEFYISIEEFSSASLLLQELFVKFPDSEMLETFKSIMGDNAGENIVSTLNDVKENLSAVMSDGEHTAEDFYDVALSNLSMGMAGEAVKYLIEANSLEPGNISYMIALADALEQNGDVKECVDVYCGALESVDDVDMKYELCKKLAVLYKDIGDDDSHNNMLEKAASLKG